MSPKRRAGGRGRSSVVTRLARRRSLDRLASVGWKPLNMRGIRQIANRIGTTRGIALLFAAALWLGTVTSHRVVEQIQGDASSASAMRVRALAVQGHERLSAARVAKASGLGSGSLASASDPERIARQLVSDAFIQSAQVATLPTGTVIVRVQEREPVALLRGAEIEGGSQTWRLVDPTGTPFARTQARVWSRLPRFRSAEALPTNKPDPKLALGLSLAALMREINGQRVVAREIQLPSEADGLGWVLHSQTLPHTVILGEDELKPRLERLALLLASSLPATRGADEIDLRFAGQAVLRSGSSSR